MMGVGKSTIGKKLAKRLGLPFVDIDKIIELKEKSTISDIFKKKGEGYFRKIEKKITLEKLKKNGLVISLGGGAILSAFVRKELKSSSISFWLDANLKDILPRLRNIRKRPLLDKENIEKLLYKIYSGRKKFYNESNFRIKCGSMKIEEIVTKIIKLYEAARD